MPPIRIHRSIDLDSILQTAVEEVMRIAGTTEVAIQLGHPEAASGNGQQVAAADARSLPEARALARQPRS